MQRSLPLHELVPAVVDTVMAGITAADDTLLLGVER